MKDAAYARMRTMIKITKQNIEKEIKYGVTAVLFWASWCEPCKTYLMRFISADTIQGLKAQFGAINLDDTTPDLLEQHRVPAVPYTVFYKDGEIVDSVLGMQEVDYLVEKIKGIL